MKRLSAVAILTFVLALVAPMYADIVPVAGTGSGTFSSPTGGTNINGSGDWEYQGGGNGYVHFAGSSFSGNTPGQFTFGTLSLVNLSNGGSAANATANLNATVTFTTPSGTVTFGPDGLLLNAVSGANGSDTVTLNFGGYPANQTFTAGGRLYTVTYDGFYDASNVQLTSLTVANNAQGTGSAFLRGTITAVPDPPVTGVPEPGSITLLGTVLLGVTAAIRRKRAVR